MAPLAAAGNGCCCASDGSETREHRQLHAFAIVQAVVEPVCAIASCALLCGPSMAGCIWSMCFGARTTVVTLAPSNYSLLKLCLKCLTPKAMLDMSHKLLPLNHA